MQDLEKLVKHFKTKYGFQCYQIAIHRDEGHRDEYGDTIINHHAHLEFVTLDETTGKNRFRGSLQRPRALGLMQTEVAQILGMERGAYKNDTIDENGNFIKGTGRKRIEPRAYAQAVEKNKRLDAVREEIKGYEALSMSVDRVLQEATGETKDLWVILDSKFKGKRLEEIIGDALAQKKTDENTALKQDYQTLETAIVDLASVVEQMEGEGEKKSFTSPSQKGTPRKLTAKELASICGKARKYMIGVNAGLGDLKLYTQKIYMAVNALKKEHRLTFDELKSKLAKIDKQAKADYKALKEQYEGYLSPDDVEAKRLDDFKSLCLLADTDSKDIPTKADEARENLRADIKQRNADLTALCEKASGETWHRPRYAKEHLEKGIDNLKKQASKAETAENAKTSLETAINATYSALIDPKEQDDDLTVQDKLKAIADKGQEQETTISGLNEDMEALQTTNATQAEQLKKIETLETALQELKGKCDTLADDLTKKGDVVTQAIESVQSLQTTNAEQAEQIKTLKEAEPKTIIKQDDTALNNLKREKDKLQDRFLGLKEKYGLKAKRIKGLRADLSKATHEVVFLTLASNGQKSQIKAFEAMQDQTYNALKRSRDRYKAMRATNKGLVTELAEAQKPKELNNAPQTQDVPKQEDTAPNPLQAEYDALKGQYGVLKQEKADIALKLENLEKSLPLFKDIDKDLAYLLQEVTKIAEINPQEASEAFDDILRYVDERKRSAEEISLQASQQKDSGGYHI
ncbi:hypothetical protein NHP190012_17110 (plasmid) [Helicobacter sp. NHP19-012]|uniref:Mobilization protein n=2 Tax=Helicobacter gastrofelis TaxID=2849642 RepID=A0ABM7SJG9_9HELI|nr:hypothetical protein NHP190012_17110 [Helicobacter sp. NHP19-012]